MMIFFCLFVLIEAWKAGRR